MGGDRKLRLCFVMFGCYPLFNREINETFGGSEVELYNLATYFAGFENIKVDFIVGDYGQNDVETYKNITVKKVKYMRLDKYKSFKHKLLRYFYLFLVLLRQNSQVYITKTACEVLGWMVIFEKFLKRKKVVFRLGSDKDADLEFWKGFRKLYFLYKLGLRHCDMVYAQSKDQKKMLKDRYGIESQVLKNVFNVSNEIVDKKKEYILWVSRCEPLKRPLIFVDLARRIPGEKFIIIMPHVRKADDLQNQRIKHIIADVKAAAEELENLDYLEFVPFNEIQQYYNRAKLFINTSEYEGFPNSFIQSCVGRTGILSLRVNPDGFLNEYDLGYCCDDSIDKAVDFIRGLDSGKIDRMGENAYNYVMQNHDILTIGRIYADDFTRLIG